MSYNRGNKVKNKYSGHYVKTNGESKLCLYNKKHNFVKYLTDEEYKEIEKSLARF